VGGEELGEVGEERAALEGAGEWGGEGALGEVFALFGLVAVGEFAVDEGPAERALGGVVGWLDVVGAGERPERRPDLEQLVGEDAVVAGVGALACGLFEQGAELVLDRFELVGEAARVVVLLEVVPGRERARGERQAGLAEALLLE
jgi:hypothetical protein